MHVVTSALVALITAVSSGNSDLLVWKRFEFGPDSTLQSMDSLSYDDQGKLLAEYRREAEGKPEYSIQFHYDDSGWASKAIKYSPDGNQLEEAESFYSGRNLVSWRRTEGNVTMDGISFHSDSAGNRIAYVQVAISAYRFTLDRWGHARRVELLGGMNGSAQGFAEFKFDSRRRHSATRFFAADSSPLGRDSILRGKSGAMSEMLRFDMTGKKVATVTYGYGPKAELKSKAYLDAEGNEKIRREHVFLPGDSLARLNASKSAWKGPAATGHCDLVWHRNIDLGIETPTLYGLFLPQSKPEKADLKPIDPNAFRDSLDRKQEKDMDWLKGVKIRFSNCKESPTPECVGKMNSELESLLRSNSGNIYLDEAIGVAAGTLLALGGDKAFADLLARARVDESTLFREAIVLDKLLDFRLAKAYSAFCLTRELVSSEPLATRVSRKVSRAPAAPSTLPTAFLDGWQYRWAILTTDLEPIEPDTGKPANWTYSGLHRHILDFLRRGKPDILDSIRPYQWGGWCGTGSEGLYGPKGKALLIVDLEKGNLRAALQATSDPERIRNLLICRGLDWERFFLGGIADQSSEARDQGIRMIAKFGSVDAIRQVLQLEAKGSEYPVWGYIETLGTYLAGPGGQIPPADPDGNESPLVRDAEAPPLPADLRKIAQGRLMAMVDRNPFALDVMLFVRIFSSVEFPNRARYLKLLAVVPNPVTRKSAVSALAKMGIKPEGLPPLEPVVLAISSKGKPLPYGSLGVGYPSPGNSASGRELSSTTISGETFTLDRWTYLHAWHEAKALRLYNYSPGYGDPLDGAIFNITFPLLESPPGPIQVDIPLHKVVLDLEFPEGFSATQEMRMQVRVSRVETGAHEGYPFEVGMRNQLVFSRLGNGTYEFEIEIQGLRKWKSGRIEIKGDAAHSATLQTLR